jgi:hypothetical protein
MLYKKVSSRQETAPFQVQSKPKASAASPKAAFGFFKPPPPRAFDTASRRSCAHVDRRDQNLITSPHRAKELSRFVDRVLGRFSAPPSVLDQQRQASRMERGHERRDLSPISLDADASQDVEFGYVTHV